LGKFYFTPKLHFINSSLSIAAFLIILSRSDQSHPIFPARQRYHQAAVVILSHQYHGIFVNQNLCHLQGWLNQTSNASLTSLIENVSRRHQHTSLAYLTVLQRYPDEPYVSQVDTNSTNNTHIYNKKCSMTAEKAH
jgi:hypothetical protein